MSREGVSKRVRMDRALGRRMAGPGPQAAPDVGGREPPAGLREQQRGRALGGLERGPAALEVARDGLQRGLPGGYEAGLGSLALDAQLLAVEVDPAQLEVDELLGAQAAAVG